MIPGNGVYLVYSRRDDVIRYMMYKYGADHVAQIITFGTMGARQAVRDVGRVMGLPYGDVDRIAKLIPFNATLDDAVRSEPELQHLSEESAQIHRVLDLAHKLEGVARHASTHAAGVIISRDPLIEHVPLQKATKGDLVMTQYDMIAVEKIGLLKMDFLGLANLTILDTAMKIIERTRGHRVDLKRIPLDDSKTYDLLAAGDVLRYAIGKKIRDKLQQQRAKFIAGCVEQGVAGHVAEQIFEQFEPFARYGFNRAHAACYGLIAYYTAYLKANYPAEYMAAVLSSDAGDTDKVAAAVAESVRMGIRVLPPDVNESFEDFTVAGDAIRFGLAAVKNVGLGSVEAILQARQETGAFTSLTDVVERVDPRAVNRRVLESLIKAGALDSLGMPRAQLLQLLDEAMEAAQRVQRARASGQTGLFDLSGETAPAEAAAPAGPVEEFSREELLAMEKEMLGLYISDHPLRHVHATLAARINVALDQLLELPDKTPVTVGGLITAVKRTTTKGGSAMAFVTLEDLTGSCEVIIFPRAYEQVHFLLKRDAVLVVRGKVDVMEQQAKILADRVMTLEEADEVEPLPLLHPAGALNGEQTESAESDSRPDLVEARGPKPEARPSPSALHVRVDTPRLGEAGLHRVRALLAQRRGDLPVSLPLLASGREVVMSARDLRVTATAELEAEIEGLLGAGSVWRD